VSRSFPLPLRVGREPEIHFVRQELGADCGDQTMTREDRAVKLSHRLPPWEGVVAASMCLSVSENPATILYLFRLTACQQRLAIVNGEDRSQ